MIIIMLPPGPTSAAANIHLISARDHMRST
jgi:hypothetical protein